MNDESSGPPSTRIRATESKKKVAAECTMLVYVHMYVHKHLKPQWHRESLWLPLPFFLLTCSWLPLFLTCVAPFSRRPYCTPGGDRGHGVGGTAWQPSGSAHRRGTQTAEEEYHLCPASVQCRRHALDCKTYTHAYYKTRVLPPPPPVSGPF